MTTKSNTISMEQKMVLIRYMETHPDLSRGKLKAKSCHDDFMRMWKEVTHQLNSCRNGPKKNLVYWRQTWNDMKKTTKAKILQRRTAGTDGPLVKLSPVQKRIAGLMCPFRSRCTVSTTNQETINSNFLEPQTCLDEGEPLNIPNNVVNETSEPHHGLAMPFISKVESNNISCMKTEPITDGYQHEVNGTHWNNTSEIEENEAPESPESQLQDNNSVVNSTCINSFGSGSQLITNASRVSSSSPALQYHQLKVPNITCANNYAVQEKVREGSNLQEKESDKFFEYQKQSAEALSQLAESHRKMAEAALRTATAEERKASALEQLVALLT